MPLLTYKDALREALDEELEKNEKVIIMGEDIGAYGGAYGIDKGLLDKYGENRVLNMPNSASTIMGAAIGAAMTGMIPIVEMASSDFLTLGIDNLINQASKVSYLTEGKSSVPLVVRVPTGISEDLNQYHSQHLETLLMNTPGLKVVSPTSPQQAKDLLKEAINDSNPVIFIENRELYDTEGLVNDQVFKLENSHVEKEGSDLSIVSWGSALEKVKELGDVLEKEGIRAEIINPITLSPLDIQPIIDSVIKTSRLVIVHDGPKTGGVGAEIAAKVMESEAFDYLDAPILRVASADSPIPFNKNQKEAVVPSKSDILNAIYTVTEIN